MQLPRIATSALCLVSLVASLSGEPQAQGPLTNERIAQLVSMGVSQAEVLRIVGSAATTAFDLTPQGTTTLTKAGVSDDVIKAMAGRETGQAVSSIPQASTSQALNVGTVRQSNQAPARVSPDTNVTLSTPEVPKAPSTVGNVSSPASGFARIAPSSTFYIEPNAGFDTFLTAALDKKHVPIAVVADRARAEYVIESANDSQKAGWARVIALGQTGSNEEASVRIVHVATGNVVWAYAVHKRNSFHGKQSSAEACAKHLKSVVR
jgi:co-chaperonin GroES (HSP10)